MKEKKSFMSNISMKMLIFMIVAAFFWMTLAAPGVKKAYAEETGTVTMKASFPDAVFELYRIGTQNSDGSFDLTSPYSDYNVNLNSVNGAATLSEYIQRDQLTADETTTSNENGVGSFTNLSKGVYLLIAKPVTYEEDLYVSAPAILVFPSYSTTGDEVWNEKVKCKFQKVPDSTKLTVRKVWKSDDEADRPESIDVQLLCDGVLADRDDAEITLDADCSWTYTWKNLKKGHVWSTVEKNVPDGYTVNNSTDGAETAVTNTSNSTPDNPPHKLLPHTGQYWVPALGLVTVGLLLILLGLLRRNRKLK